MSQEQDRQAYEAAPWYKILHIRGASIGWFNSYLYTSYLRDISDCMIQTLAQGPSESSSPSLGESDHSEHNEDCLIPWPYDVSLHY